MLYTPHPEARHHRMEGLDGIKFGEGLQPYLEIRGRYEVDSLNDVEWSWKIQYKRGSF